MALKDSKCKTVAGTSASSHTLVFSEHCAHQHGTSSKNALPDWKDEPVFTAEQNSAAIAKRKRAKNSNTE
jgi:hypothetical protein